MVHSCFPMIVVIFPNLRTNTKNKHKIIKWNKYQGKYVGEYSTELSLDVIKEVFSI